MVDQTAYMEPLPKFFELGYPTESQHADWPDYPATYGLTQAHIPDLIQLMTQTVEDNALDDDEWPEPEGYAPIHAWRALGQLKAVEAIPHMLQLIAEDDWEEWGWEDLTQALALIGEPVIEPLKKQLRRDAQNVEGVLSLISTLEYIGNDYPELRERCIASLIDQLKYAPTNDASVNGFAILVLSKWKAERALGIIERAFATDNVDVTVMGDWYDVQVEFGLKEPRPVEDISPVERLKQQRKLFGLPESPDSTLTDDWAYLEPITSEANQEEINQERKKEKEKEKRRAKKKVVKKARKRNRKK